MEKRKFIRIIAICMIIVGVLILGILGYKKISREIYLKNLLENNTTLEIPSLNILVPVLEGTDGKSLEVSAGHFIGRGSPGLNNYCIAGHSSTIYAEIFDDLDKIQIGDKIIVDEINGNKYIYIVDEYRIVAPTETNVLNDFGDNRITIVSCTDDGKYRQIVVGKLAEDI